MSKKNTSIAAARSDLLARINRTAEAIRAERPSLYHCLKGMTPHVPPNRLEAFAEAADMAARHERSVQLSEFLELLITGNRVALWGASLKFQTRSALVTIAEEILVRREYHFNSRSDAPLVIDAGANIGLATYYVRRMCKAARVVCFEPNPETFAVLEENARANAWDNVALHQAAVAAQDGEVDLTFDAEAPLAASVAPRSSSEHARSVRVPALGLSAFLQEPVAFLKMDIEGAEADVLEACEGDLGLVENLFVEVHPVPGESPSLLWRVLGVLERAGFRVHVSRSPWSEAVHGLMPMTKAHRTYSLSVFATRLTD